MRLLVFSSNSWSDKICQLPEVGGATNKKADAFCAVGFRSLPALPLIEGWNLSIWLAGFVAIELALYFAIELTLVRLFPRLKQATSDAEPTSA